MRVKVTVQVDRIKFPNLQLEELRCFIADSLRFEQASSVEEVEDNIRFTVGFFRPMWNWKLLSSIYGGEVNLRSDTKRFFVASHLCFTDTVVIVTLLIGGLALANYQAIFVEKGLILLYLLAWLWFVGGNIMTSAYRWRRFIRRCAREAADRVIISRERLVANQRSAHERA